MASNLISLEITEDPKIVCFVGNTYSYKDMIKAIAGNSWNKKKKRWEVPLEAVADALRVLPTLKVSSEVQKAFKTLKARNDKAIAVKELTEARGTVKGLKGKLYPYQAVGKAFLDNLQEGEGAILAFDMGLGKSLTSLAMALEWLNTGVIEHILVICPAPLKYSTWEKEVKKWTNLNYIVIDGDKSEVVEWDDGTKERLKGKKLREVQYQQWAFDTKVIIMNYELFLHDFDVLPPIDETWCVVMDEVQRCKNPKAKTTKNIHKVVKPAGRKILGSGTPLENNIQELWSLVELCRPGLLGNYYKFIDRYCVKDFFGSVVAPKPEMMKELMDRIAPIMIRKTKQEALPDLPELIIQDYWVDMTAEQRKLYKQLKDGVVKNMETQEFTYLETLAQLTRFQQLVDSPKLLEKVTGTELPVESGKLNELKSIIEDLNPTKNKFILFSQYKEMTDILYQWVIDQKLLPKEQIGYIHGGMKSVVTGRIQQEFQEGNIQCIIMTTAGNYGLDLYKGTYVICYDELFNPQKMEQIYSRCHRNGAKNAVTVLSLRTRGTYEERKVSILEKKRELFRAMVDADDESFARLFTTQELINLI
jgi:SNF2 family DNA or RNA helicase